MDHIRNNMAARANDLRLYLDYNPDPVRFQQLHADPSNPPIMIFLKWFDFSRQTLTGQGKIFVSQNDKVSSLFGYIQERMSWAPNVPIKLYEVCLFQLPVSVNHALVLTSPQEIKAGMIEGLKVKSTFKQNELQDGDVLTYQIEIPDKE